MGRLALTAWLVLVLILILLFAITARVPPEPSPAASEPAAAALRVLHRGQVLALAPEEYLVGVVAAEMPADFEPEALKAQAVAARTYALWCAAGGKHADADICTDCHCCQAWKTEADMRAAWDGAFDDRLARVRDAVDSTAGQVLRFAGAPAFTAFHSSSAGFTEDCGAIWNGLPYLVSVASPETAESVPNFVSHVACTPNELQEKLLSICPEADFTGAPEDWLGAIRRDASGRVAEAVLGGVPFSGVKLRELFSLRSTAFALSYADGVFLFTVTGFGHGVGMSQYGANVMAAQGADYRAILAHYYPGTELASLW